MLRGGGRKKAGSRERSGERGGWEETDKDEQFGVGAYTEKPSVRIYMQTIGSLGWALTQRWALTRDNILTCCV